MLLRLLILFISIPLIELTLLLVLSDFIGWYSSLLIVIISGIIGSYLAHRQGWATWQKIWAQAGSGSVPGSALVDAAMILLAGGMLLTPGLLTDAFGISLLIPYCRNIYKGWAMKYLKMRMEGAAADAAKKQQQADAGDARVIDSYVVERKTDDS